MQNLCFLKAEPLAFNFPVSAGASLTVRSVEDLDI